MARLCYRVVEVLRSPSGALLLACAVFQFTHWLKPMQAYIVDYAAQVSAISSSTMEDDVLPWFTYVLTPCTLLAGAVFELCGGFAALLVSAVTDVASAWLVMQGRNGNALPITLSEVAFGFSFTSLFTVNACLTAGVPETQYQLASSLNRGAWLASAVVAAGVGQALDSAGQLPATGSVSFITSIVSAVLLLLFWLGGAFGSVPGPVCCRNFRRDTLRACGCGRAGADGAPSTRRRADAAGGSAAAAARFGEGDGDGGLGGGGGGAYAWLDEVDAGSVVSGGLPPPSKADLLLVSGAVPPRFVLTSGLAADSLSIDGDGAGAGADADAELCSATRCLCRGARPPGSSGRGGSVSAWAILWRCCRDMRALLLGICLAVILAVHTLVMVHWQPLLDDIKKGEGVNGGVLAAAYVAAIVLTSVIALPRLERVLAAWGLRVCAAVLTVCTGCLFGMAATASLAVSATCLVAYHAVAEAVLALLYAQLGHAVVQLGTPMLLPQRGLLPGVGAPIGAIAAGHTGYAGHLQIPSSGGGDGDGGGDLSADALAPVGGGASAAISARLHFGSIFTAVTMLSQLVQLAIQYGIGAQGLNLPLRHKFYVLAACTAALFVIVAIAIVGAPLRLDAPLGPTHPAQMSASGASSGSGSGRRASKAFLVGTSGSGAAAAAAGQGPSFLSASGGLPAGIVSERSAVGISMAAAYGAGMPVGAAYSPPGDHYHGDASGRGDMEASLLGYSDGGAGVNADSAGHGEASFPRALDAAVDHSYGY